ncbi:MAG: hypothetical protein ABEJ65_03745 [bacterium]
MRQRFIPFICCLCVTVLCLGLSVPLQAETSTHRRFLQSKSKHAKLFSPTSIQVNPNGRIAVWDADLRDYRYYAHTDSGIVELNGDSGPSMLRRYWMAQEISNWGNSRQPRGIWDSSNRYWVVENRSDSPTDTTPISLRVIYGDGSIRKKLKGPVKTITPSEDRWIVQRPWGSLAHWDPMSVGGLSDTRHFDIQGRYLGGTPDGHIFTVEKNEVRVFNGNGLKNTRVYPDLTAASFVGGKLYVLVGSREIVSLNKNLGVEFRHTFRGGYSFRDFDVKNKTLYLTGKKGLYRASLEESKSSFFHTSSRVKPELIVGTYPHSNNRDWARSVWVKKASEKPHKINFKVGKNQIREIKYHSDTGFFPTRDRARVRNVDDVPYNVSQSLNVEQSYWNGTNRITYFFPDRNSVETFDGQGRPIRKTKVKFKSLKFTNDIKFIGADPSRILFSARVIYPDNGFQPTILVYDWKGNFVRAFRPRRPGGEEVMPQSNQYPRWRYDGEYLYGLYSDHIQQFDLLGYPGSIIRDVIYPTDVQISGQKLFVLDIHGLRLSSYNRPDAHEYRYATPPDYTNVKEAVAISDRRVILSAVDADNNKQSKFNLKELKLPSRDIQHLLDHSTRSLRYLQPVKKENTLFFWGRENRHEESRLFKSDIKRYQARTTSQASHVIDRGTVDSEHDLYLFPVQSGDTSTEYRYLHLNGDTTGRIRNTATLRLLSERGFDGFYGVRRDTDTDRAWLVSGYIDQKFDTSPYRWNVADTMLTFNHEPRQILPRNGSIYISVETEPDFTKLGIIENPGNDTPSISWTYSARGTLSWVLPSSPKRDKHLILHRVQNQGTLVELYQPGDVKTGGFQASLTSAGPNDLSNIELQVQPGGKRIKTTTGGNFTISDLPVGYQELMAVNHKHRLKFPERFDVESDEYEPRNDIPVQINEDFGVLERGMNNYRKGRLEIAGKIFKFYRKQEFPNYRWAGILLKDVYRQLDQPEKLQSLYDKQPDIFSVSDKLYLYKHTGTPPLKPLLKQNIYFKNLDPINRFELFYGLP